MDVKVIDTLPSYGFYKFRQDQLIIVRKICNMEDPEKIRQSIEILRGWLRKQDYFNKRDQPDIYFEKLLVVCKGSMERCKTRIDKMCTLRTIWPMYFDIADVDSFMEDFKIYHSIHLHHVTEDGTRVSLSKLYDTKTLTADTIIRFTKYVITLCEYAMAHDYSNGYVAIVDFRDVNMIDLLAFSTCHFTLLQQTITILMDGYGMRLRSIHLLTTSKATDALVTFLKKLLPVKLANRINVHKDINTLYAYVPNTIMPSDFGGDEPSFNELHEEFIKELFSKKHRKWLEAAHQATIDESKKPKDYFSDDYISISGSFRTLSVD